MKIMLFFLFFLIPTFCISQNEEYSTKDALIYFDSLGAIATKENYKYYRIVKDYQLNKDIYIVKDYYKSGVLLMEGTSITKGGTTREGEFVSYYKNGNKKAITNYVKSRPIGKCFEWYENGNKKLEGEYIEDEKTLVQTLKIFQFWNSEYVQKVIDGNGDYEEILSFFFASGKMKDGFKDGIWKGSDKKLGYTFVEKYENKKLISGRSIDKNNIARDYNIVESGPKFKNGISDFYKHITKNFRVPEVEDLKGKIYISFIIDKNGNVVNPKILKGLGLQANEEAKRVLSSYNNFMPGQRRGINIECSYSLPITVQSSN
jgi:antitoxin component YwqK of YwqJK toxin-antitoxin module